ncbi:type VII secretion protein EccCa [Cellulomonas dongxiuzhuiae]|uniref:Type VII secretion protein EccCa n=1 Tax=Cellulomonas dongxiuzhuiae TaxID=2819979 RepID=A0ABX8GL52_9CELL|nr:type VII secretion protein EccCa [Cellulomonas dongxiuzhuiae]MBO3095607.1 type VII secretion protein EccCa [Cellulomonas dongxiuzhuiae]QWC16573.1 type VII secretion protein EccCa [Cellulomonas dongxiuzhuiae]
MTVTVVHRPTRSTTPATRPEPRTLAAPPASEDDQGSRTPLQFLLPVIGAMSSVVMMVVLRNGQPLFLVVAALVFVVAIIGGIGFALTARGRAARTARARREAYLDYLERVRGDLTADAAHARVQALTVHPDPAALGDLVRDPARVWERRRRDADFLTVRVGTGAVPWFDLVVPPPESPVSPHDPHMATEVELLVEQYAHVPQMPVTADLRAAGVVAVVGDRERTVPLVRALLLHLAAAHSPEDVQLAAAYPEQHAPDWRGLDLLPHVADPDLFDGPVPARRVAPDLADLSRLLSGALGQRLTHARAASRTGGQVVPSGRLVVVSDDHGRRAQRLAVPSADHRALGVVVVHLLDDRLQEPDDVDVRIVLDEEGAVLQTAPGTPAAREQRFDADGLTAPVFAALARGLAALRTGQVTAPDEEDDRTPSVHDLLGIDGPATLDPAASWSSRADADFLRVPFAWDDSGTPVHLDLKESAQLGMGPHGICVGATGSGKSEMLRTLLLALALTHPPEDLAMILVDYKGGAAFAPLAPLPHLAGLIDNLADDPQLTTRARASIAGEVVRRQRMLKDAGSLPSITAYRRLRATERPDLPAMPHLFVVIDEFGELLTAEPEFVDLFLQIGRIGRSIGVHLLLSSQRVEAGKLRGLDTYLSYRLGLRTFSEAESQVVLSTPDAYRLPALPGYGYLKVDTTVYTRFRSGYVSGPAGRAEEAPVDDQRSVLALPTYNGLRADRRPRTATRGDDRGPTLVGEVVRRLRTPERAVRPVWLPPLPDRLALGSLVRRGEQPGGGLSAVMGLVDDPAQQTQEPWQLDLTRSGGHVAVIGAPQSGRTTVLRTLAVSLALTSNPRQVAVYGMDLTGGGLARIEAFPHVGGVATRAHRERLVRLVEELSAMIAVREAVFRDRGIDSVAHLRALHARGGVPELAAADVVVLVDGYGQLRTDFPELEDAFTAAMTRAASFGLHLVLGLTRWSDLRMAHQSLIGTRVELRLNDPAESSIDRKLSATISTDTPGRALLDDRRFAQVSLPVLDVVPDDEVGAELEQLAGRAAAAWSGPAAAPIRLLPTHVDAADLPDRFDEPDTVPIGLRQDTMDAALWDLLGEDQHLLVLGDARCGKTTLLRTIAAGLQDRYTADEVTIAVVDVRGQVPEVIGEDYLAAHARTTANARALATSIAAELAKRPGRDAATRAREPRIVLLVDDHDVVAAGGNDPLEPLFAHLPAARDLKLHLVVTRPVAGAGRALYQQSLMTIRDTGGSTLVMSGERTEGPLVGRVHAERFPPGRGRYVRRGAAPFIVQVAAVKDDQVP